MIEAKNKVFFLIPALKDCDAGEDIVYLKVLQTATQTDIIDIFKAIVESKKLISEEDVDYFFDKKHFDVLYKMVKTQRNVATKNKRRPSELAPLLSLLDNIKSLPDIKHGNNPIFINGKKITKGLVNAFSEYSKDNNVALVNKNALDKPDKPLKISTDVDNPQRSYSEIEVYPCEKNDLYIWLCENRLPKRVYDAQYEKHSGKVKGGKRGKTISAMTYSNREAGRLLQWALRANKVGHTELYLFDIEKHKLIIFYDERLEFPTFHGHEIDKNDKENWQSAMKRIQERGKKTDLDDRIRSAANIIQSRRKSILE